MDVRFLIGLVVALAATWAAFLALLWIVRPRDVALAELVRIVPDLLRLVRDLIVDETMQMRVRVALVVLLLWLVNPIDLIPEFIPVLGPLDDVIVAVLILRYVRRRVGESGIRRRWRGTDSGFALLQRVLGSG
jgi:uncharacterized membrane protein YkvA (DUF1232 family)